MLIKTKTLRVAASMAVVAGFVALASPATAAVTFDPETGIGFVGKGDVQTVFELNNKELQSVATSVDFRVNVTSATTWSCTKTVELGQGNGGENENEQVRNRTVTTQGLVTTVARDNSKGKDGGITGFYLNGYEDGATTVTDGPEVGSCPSSKSGFVYNDDATTVVTGGGLEVTKDGSLWVAIQ